MSDLRDRFQRYVDELTPATIDSFVIDSTTAGGKRTALRARTSLWLVAASVATTTALLVGISLVRSNASVEPASSAAGDQYAGNWAINGVNGEFAQPRPATAGRQLASLHIGTDGTWVAHLYCDENSAVGGTLSGSDGRLRFRAEQTPPACTGDRTLSALTASEFVPQVEGAALVLDGGSGTGVILTRVSGPRQPTAVVSKAGSGGYLVVSLPTRQDCNVRLTSLRLTSASEVTAVLTPASPACSGRLVTAQFGRALPTAPDVSSPTTVHIVVRGQGSLDVAAAWKGID